RVNRDGSSLEGQTNHRECSRRHSYPSNRQVYRRPRAFLRRMCISNPLSADASGVWHSIGQEWPRACKGEFPDDDERSEMGAIVANSRWAHVLARIIHEKRSGM